MQFVNTSSSVNPNRNESINRLQQHTEKEPHTKPLSRDCKKKDVLLKAGEGNDLQRDAATVPMVS